MADICMKCAALYGDTSKGGIGVWKGTCSICEDSDVFVAVSGYDFGISDDTLTNIKSLQRLSRSESKGKWGML